MAVQSSFYLVDGSTRTFPSTKHIATKQHCAIYLKDKISLLWSVASVETYTLINNSIVFDIAPASATYSDIEVRVADTQDELVDLPSDIAIVASNIADVQSLAANIDNINSIGDNLDALLVIPANLSSITSVASDVTNINLVANNITAVDIVSNHVANIDSVSTTIVPNIAEILLADDNASIATAQAVIATEMANTVTSIYDQFDDRYLGSKLTAPTLDNDGNALLIGALYFDTTTNLMKIYGSSGWVSAGSSVNGTTERHTYTATAGQTSFTANYESGYVDVYLNGSKLQIGVDFTATSGTAIVLTSSANVGDIVDIIAYGVFEVANTTPKGNEAYTVSTVADLVSIPSSYTTAIVKDLDRGGTFIWSSTGTANGGTVFAGATGYWTRQEVTTVYSASNYATKTLHDSVTGVIHVAGTEYSLSKAITGYDAWTYGLIEFDITTTTSGLIKLQINGADIFGDQPNGYLFSTDTILLDGTENNRILDNHTYTFAIGSISSAITSIGLVSDTSWAGTVTSIKLYKLAINSMDFEVVAESDIGQNYATGIKCGQRARGDMAFGDTSALMAFQYDGVSPTPAYNLAVGYGALASNQRGDENTAIGSMSLMNNEGSNNVAVGYSSLKMNTKGQENTSVGYKAGISNTTGYRNTYLGFWAGQRNNTGINNTVVGWQNNTTGINKSYVTSIGANAGSGYSGSNNTFVGSQAGYSTSGQEDLAGSYITSIGNETRPRGNSSVALGFQATVGTESVFADYAIAIGRGSNSLLTGNIALGYLANASGATQSIAIGKSSTAIGSDGCIAIGETTIASGARSITIGQSSSAVGQQSVSLGALTVAGAGDYNTNIGSRAGLGFAGSLNTFVGRLAGNQTVTYSNCSLLGAGTAVTGSNQVQLGGSATTTYVYGTVQNRSDARDKAEIKDTALGLNFIEKLRPVDFKWDMRDYYKVIDDETGEVTYLNKDGSKVGKRFHHGLIAQEVEAIITETGIDFGGFQNHSVNGGSDVLSIGYDELIAPLIKAVQELSQRVKALEQK